MKIRHELIREVVRAMGPQENTATAIANAYHDLGGGELALYRITDPVAQSDLVRRNRLNLFRPEYGWLEGRTAEQRRKTQELLPALLAILPDDLAARLLVENSLEYRAMDAAEESIRAAKHAFVQTQRELFIHTHHKRRDNDGRSVGGLVH